MIDFHVLLLLSLAVCVLSSCTDQVPLLGFLSKKRGQAVASMCRAHSHNDYHQADPLSSALRHGLKSVEVDVFPRNGGLWVAHTIMELNPRRTIDNLYIQPLLKMVKGKYKRGLPRNVARSAHAADPTSMLQSKIPGFKTRRRLGERRFLSTSTLMNQIPIRGGAEERQRKPPLSTTTNRLPWLTKAPDHLNLLVDFKGDPNKSATLLQTALSPLRPFLSKVDNKGVFRPGRITVLISGNRPSLSNLQAPNGERFLFLDGRVHDIHKNSDTHVVPLVSLPWRQVRLFKAVGRGEHYMRRMTAKAHAQGKIVRIWGAPNREASWTKMVRGNIDLLSIDDHARFARFVSNPADTQK